MIIREIYIENFGKLSKYQKTFSDGLNHFVEENGFGKTTLTVFIKTMLYGFDESRKQSLDENDRKKYTPWQGGAFGGWLIFTLGKKNYRIERSFGTKSSDDTFNLYDLDTGTVSYDFPDPLGEAIFGIDADGFERTVFLSEKNLSGKNTNPTISAKLSNLVGTEGDIGGFDEAIKLLEDRRRFYQKKGGAGEIADARRDISEIEDEITRLKAKKENLSTLSKEASDISDKIAAIKAKKEKVLEKQRMEQLAREKRGYEIQYSEMLGALKIDEARESELLRFFEKKIPTNAEIASVAESYSELKRIEKNLASISENRELSELTEFFARGASASECEAMCRGARKISEDKSLLFKKKEAFKEAGSPFVKEPSYSDIDRFTMELTSSKAKEKSFRGTGILLSIIGIVLLIFGLTIARSISETICYTSSIVGVPLTIVGIISLFVPSNPLSQREKEKAASEFIARIYGTLPEDGNLLSTLITMRTRLDKYNTEKQLAKGAEEEIGMLEASIIRTEREVRDYLSRYPKSEALTLEEATLEISRKYQRYTLLSEYERERDSERGAEREKIIKLREYVNSFLLLFNTSTADPIGEIRRNLAEFDVLRSSLSRRRTDAERFAASHGITEFSNEAYENLPSVTSFKDMLAEIDDELIAAERERSRLLVDYNASVAETEKIDELEERLYEKNETVDKYLDNLAVINKTKEILALARDSMTSKYLDKTRKGFQKYVTLINEECGEYTIDTSFTVTKTDFGKSRQAEAYSRGTRDLHSLAMRLSLVDALYEDTLPPIILDDPFIAFDDKHIERSISVIKKLADKRQIFYFTCSKSRKAK